MAGRAATDMLLTAHAAQTLVVGSAAGGTQAELGPADMALGVAELRLVLDRLALGVRAAGARNTLAAAHHHALRAGRRAAVRALGAGGTGLIGLTTTEAQREADAAEDGPGQHLE